MYCSSPAECFAFADASVATMISMCTGASAVHHIDSGASWMLSPRIGSADHFVGTSSPSRRCPCAGHRCGEEPLRQKDRRIVDILDSLGPQRNEVRGELTERRLFARSPYPELLEF